MSESEKTTPSHTQNIEESSDGVHQAAIASRYVRTLPFADMPGSGRNEALNAGRYGRSGWILVGVACILLVIALAMYTYDYSEEWSGQLERYEMLANLVLWTSGAMFLVGIAFLAVCAQKFGQHHSNAYALQVAVARNLGQLQGFDVGGMTLQESKDLILPEGKPSMWAARKPESVDRS